VLANAQAIYIYIYLVFYLYILRLESTVVINVLIDISCLRVNNQILQKFEVYSILHAYASEFSSTPKGELFCKFCDCLVKSAKRFMVEAHHHSAKHQ